MQPSNNSSPKKSYTAIALKMIVYLAWRNLVSKKLRTFLTIFGVIIGIGAIFFLLSFGLGVQNLVTKEIVGNSSVKSIDISSSNTKVVKLDRDAIEKFRNLPHVQSSGLQIASPGSMQHKGASIDTIVYGVDQGYFKLTDNTIEAGRLFTDNDAKVIVLNEAALKALGYKNANDALKGKLSITISLKDKVPDKTSIKETFQIIGVVQSGSGSEVYIPTFVFENEGVKNYTQMKIITDDSKFISSLRSQIQSYGFDTTSPSDTIDQINQIFKFFNVILVGFGAIGMIVAVLGMFNTLTISLLERTREIGLMMALGGRNRDMSKLFIFEAVLLSLSGAMIGILLAVILGKIVNFGMNSFAHHRGVHDSFELFAIPIWLILALLGFMVIVGLLVAFFPAKRAKRISPIDALRRE